MTGPIDALMVQAKAAADQARTDGATAPGERERLERLASEFESMLLNQMLREMRKAGRWEDENGESDNSLAALFETLDAEFSKQMTRAQGFGLTREMMAAFDRTAPVESSAAALTPAASRLSLVSSELGAGTDSVVERQRGSRALDVTGGRDITSAFGDRRDPFTGATRFHRGVDLRAAYGQDVATAAGGTVAFSGTQGGYGTTVVVEHANGTRTRFAHLSVALVAPGQAVEPGQVVGRAGSSGRATGAHLHLEVTDRDGQPLNPLIHPDSHR